MDCIHFRNNIVPFQDGSLPEEDLSSAVQHLSDCSSCARIYTGLLHFEELILLEKSSEPGPFTSTRILQRLENEFYGSATPVSNTMIRILQPVVVAIAMACGILIGSYSAKKENTQTNQATNKPEQIEFLRADLFISDFADEDKNLVSKK
jgi:hypothetical protein